MIDILVYDLRQGSKQVFFFFPRYSILQPPLPDNLYIPPMTYHLIIILHTEDLRGAVLSDCIFFKLTSSFVIRAL